MARHDDEPRPLDLRTLELRPGEARTLTVPVTVADLVIADQRYISDPPEPEATVDVSQSASGWHFRVRTATELVGPCWRCLGEARVPLEADVRDFSAFGREGRGEYDEDLDCEYLTGEELDLTGMTRDALLDLLPAIILCRDDCAGLCPTCGVDRNTTSCDCAPPADSRWDALREIADRLGDGDPT